VGIRKGKPASAPSAAGIGSHRSGVVVLGMLGMAVEEWASVKLPCRNYTCTCVQSQRLHLQKFNLLYQQLALSFQYWHSPPSSRVEGGS